jgi:hypothetical protein
MDLKMFCIFFPRLLVLVQISPASARKKEQKNQEREREQAAGSSSCNRVMAPYSTGLSHVQLKWSYFPCVFALLQKNRPARLYAQCCYLVIVAEIPALY